MPPGDNPLGFFNEVYLLLVMIACKLHYTLITIATPHRIYGLQVSPEKAHFFDRKNV